ncbi:uncharacterized protein ATNIH1004_008642 [Aspergillus tanneri]|uniref:DUF676 domain-containing protein n=1 Tax=Aspergillus tanneri TaxID=1220188 RepID=A0A5M9MC05_9EURO|nr:uncharacterized protein ATNIH1004_008642 [Aspergillus tanneri]KAA8644438.1 hypothetical protein ATNIH1004_008642 [Aspergillus tanneri]
MTGTERLTAGRKRATSSISSSERRFYDDKTKPHNPYGITVLCEPVNVAPTVDIIFVHGLAGTSMYTWSKKDRFDRLARFWPLKWLRDEGFLQTARISTFGYYANISPRGPKNTLTIADFSNQLLSDLKFAVDIDEEYQYGSIPIIFVVHSMGGLVACVVGQLDTKFNGIARSTCSILFLATPHKGSDCANILSRGLKFPLLPSREYVKELEEDARGLKQLNQEFQRIPNLTIVSFYETIACTFGPWQKTIVKRESAVSGYPEETVISLVADHRGVCKFSSKTIAYQAVCSVPEFRKKLAKVAETGHVLDHNDMRVIWQELFIAGLFNISVPRVSFWVIDGLDACDTPWLLDPFMGLISSLSYPLRIMFISRPTLAPSLMAKLVSSEQSDFEQIHMPGAGIREFTQEEMQNLSVLQDPNLKRKLVDIMLQRSKGNFKWVNMALRELRQCTNEDRLIEILEEFRGEPALHYRRIDNALVAGLNSREKELGATILMWVTYSRRQMTLEELAAAICLEEEDTIEIHRKIYRVCGDLTVVDSKARVKISDNVAIQDLPELLSTTSFAATAPDAHVTMFRRCLSALRDPVLRVGKPNPNIQPFLEYAATSWFYHLSAVDGTVKDGHFSRMANCFHPLVEFFDSPFVLIWVCFLASMPQLLALEQAAQAITLCLFKMSENIPETAIRNASEEGARVRLQMWSKDLVKILGRFGDQLISHPLTIYDLIPRFCPPRSRIHSQFCANNSTSGLEIKGMPFKSWDETFSKIAAGRSYRAENIVCGDKYFALSTKSPQGGIKIFRSRTCEELLEISHGERVMALRLSFSGDLLASYGRHSTKVWDLVTGRQIYIAPNPQATNILAITFAKKDSILLVCTDDGFFRRASMESNSGGWQVLDFRLTEGSQSNLGRFVVPLTAAFNTDGTRLAIVCPRVALKAYKVDPRNENRVYKLVGETGLTNVMQVDWAPITGHIVGVGNDGTVFKWHPQEQRAETFQDSAVGVRCSPNSQFLVVSYANGALGIRDFHDYSSIHSIFSPTTVTEFCISPDSRRIYDLRDSHCTVWEPTPLTQNSSSRHANYKLTKKASHDQEEAAKSFEPITALAVGCVTSRYCTGGLDGKIKVFESGSYEQEVDLTNLSIEHLAWSNDEKFLAIGDLGNWLRILSIEHGEQEHSKIQLVFESSVGESIHQFLFGRNSTELLVVTQESFLVFKLANGFHPTRWRLPKKGCQWINHPCYEALLVGFNPEGAIVARWDNLGEYDILNFCVPLHKPGENEHFSHASATSMTTHIVRAVFASQFEPKVLLQLYHPGSPNQDKGK